MLIARRGFLVGLGALIAAPAVVRASSLMQIRAPQLILPGTGTLVNWLPIQPWPEEVLPILSGLTDAVTGLPLGPVPHTPSPLSFAENMKLIRDRNALWDDLRARWWLRVA
jgi:hypothetical protein